MNITKTIDNKYEIHREIKRGGFGVIYYGVDLLFDKPVAIKAVDPSLLNEAKYIDMFQAEALSVARLNHHNIVHVYDIKRDLNGQFYIIMEYIDGPTLSQLLRVCQRTNTHLPTHLGVYIIAESCAGLDYAHNRRNHDTNAPLNLVHQDISPSNLMITRNGELKIIDFGMANLRRQQPKKKNEIIIQGKMNYLAPEQVNGSQKLDRRVDVFSLGLILYEILAGERLIKADDPKEVVEKLRSGKLDISKIETVAVPAKLQEVVRRSLAHDVELRYPSANHMYMDLMHYLILTTPTADFMSELAEFVQKIYPPEKPVPEDTATMTASLADENVGTGNHVVNAMELPSAQDATEFAPTEDAKRTEISPSEGTGEQPEAKSQTPKDHNGTVDGETGLHDLPDTGHENALPKELTDISDTAAQNIENKSGEAISDDKPGAGTAPQETSDTHHAQFAGAKAATEQVEAEPIAAFTEDDNKNGTETPTDEISTEKLAEGIFGRVKTKKRGRGKRDKVAPPKKAAKVKTESRSSDWQDEKQKATDGRPADDDDSEAVVKILDADISPKSASPSEFYSIIDEPDDDEELKTIIDVVRLSARTHKKALIFGLLAVVAAFVLFTMIDTFGHFTAYGASIYDFISPPAIKVESTPPGAQVYLDDKPLQETTPMSIRKISPGVHKLMLTQSRFDPIVKSITVPGKGKLQVAGESARHPGQPFVFHFSVQLELSSQPPGADVFINGVSLSQKTPLTTYWEVNEEPIKIVMVRPGFPQLAGMEINGIDGKESISDRRFWKFQKLDRVKDHFAIEGVFRKGITINSNPGRAEIYLDESDKPVGVTGLSGNLLLTIGQHSIVLQKNGYLDRRFSITVDENTPEVINEALLRNVQISARAAETDDNNDLGARLIELRSTRQSLKTNETTPTTLRLLSERYTAVLQRAGYQETYIQIMPNETAVVAKMQPLPAKISLLIVDADNNEPLGAVQITYANQQNGGTVKPLGETNLSGALEADIAPGFYEFFVVKPGYDGKSKVLQVRNNQRNRLTFRLTSKK